MKRYTPRFYKLQQQCRTAVRKAIQQGKLTRKGCRDCGTLQKVHAHHDDHRKPMTVIWLCAKHHIARHQWLDALGWLGNGVPRYRNKIIRHHDPC